jgi:hypothetical protein
MESHPRTTTQMAEEAEYSKVTIIHNRRNLRQFRGVYAPPTRIGQKLTVTPLIIDALCDNPLEGLPIYLDEIAGFLLDKLRTMITSSSIRRARVAKS